MIHSVRFLPLAFGLVFALPVEAAKPIPRELFGQNLEHTRGAVEGGLSAQIVRNRKFAAKPSHDGLAPGWTGFGGRGCFDHRGRRQALTRHEPGSKMFRQNERGAQFVGCYEENGEKGIRQDRLGFRAGVMHECHAWVRAASFDRPVTFRLRLADAEGRTLATRDFTVRTKDENDWTKIALTFTPQAATYGSCAISVVGRAAGLIGVVSILPDDAFHGMRRDVIEAMREIGTTIVRWPGGNFAGDYRWRDGLIKDRDFRAPLQSFTELETQSDSWGYDSNDLATDDILALCDKLGAMPYFTLNLAWDTPEESLAWIRYCGDRVKWWSLGNEMGYNHMENAKKGPAGYVELVTPTAEAILKERTDLTLTTSGIYPGWGGCDDWIGGAAVPLSRYAKIISYHTYAHGDERLLYDFSTPESTAAVYAKIEKSVDENFEYLRRFRARLPKEIAISYDEWNLWYVWCRDDGIAEGLFALKMLHNFLTCWEEMNLVSVCYFQAVSEFAIRVEPFGCRLTSAGEALRLAKGHIGGVPVEGLAEGAFATDAADGTRYVSLLNFSTTKPKTYRLPAQGRTSFAGERLVPNGLEIGCRYSRQPLVGTISGETLEITLQPAEMAAVRLMK